MSGDIFLHKKCSRYLGFLTEIIEKHFSKDGYKLVTTNSGKNTAKLIYNKGGNYRSIEQYLTPPNLAETLSHLTVEIEMGELAAVEALLKSLKMPKVAISVGD